VSPEPWCQPDGLDSPEAKPAPLLDVDTNGAVAAHDRGQQSLNAADIRLVEDRKVLV
jgi:hypothetical protein